MEIFILCHYTLKYLILILNNKGMFFFLLKSQIWSVPYWYCGAQFGNLRIIPTYIITTSRPLRIRCF